MAIPIGSNQKKIIYQLENVPDFHLSIFSTISTKTAKKRQNILLKTKDQCNQGFISMVSDAPKLSFRKAILEGDFKVAVVFG